MLKGYLKKYVFRYIFNFILKTSGVALIDNGL